MNMENLEFCQETLMGQPISEIPPQPPFRKGGQVGDSTLRGGFLAGPGYRGKYNLLVGALAIYG
jgi:hypothetical protein